jgi:hypothetical protein
MSYILNIFFCSVISKSVRDNENKSSVPNVCTLLFSITLVSRNFGFNKYLSDYPWGAWRTESLHCGKFQLLLYELTENWILLPSQIVVKQDSLKFHDSFILVLILLLVDSQKWKISYTHIWRLLQEEHQEEICSEIILLLYSFSEGSIYNWNLFD